MSSHPPSDFLIAHVTKCIRMQSMVEFETGSSTIRTCICLYAHKQNIYMCIDVLNHVCVVRAVASIVITIIEVIRNKTYYIQRSSLELRVTPDLSSIPTNMLCVSCCMALYVVALLVLSTKFISSHQSINQTSIDCVLLLDRKIYVTFGLYNCFGCVRVTLFSFRQC